MEVFEKRVMTHLVSDMGIVQPITPASRESGQKNVGVGENLFASALSGRLQYNRRRHDIDWFLAARE